MNHGTQHCKRFHHERQKPPSFEPRDECLIEGVGFQKEIARLGVNFSRYCFCIHAPSMILDWFPFRSFINS